MATDLGNRISIDPAVMVGKPCIRGTRVTVEHVLRELAAGNPIEQILREHPRLTEEDVRAAQLFAADYCTSHSSIKHDFRRNQSKSR